MKYIQNDGTEIEYSERILCKQEMVKLETLPTMTVEQFKKALSGFANHALVRFDASIFTMELSQKDKFYCKGEEIPKEYKEPRFNYRELLT
jgi:hypothetical protein